MIVYFPSAYSDELVYSLLARFYEKSGYTAYILAAEELYVRKTVKPSIEFINEFTDDTVQLLTKDMSMEELVLKHTLFPYYARFMKQERRQRAFDSMVSMDKQYQNALCISKQRTNKESRYLRYCPVCVEEDREQYGETYWHRAHQLSKPKICAKHKCYLVNSHIEITSNDTPALISAETEISDNITVHYSQNKTEHQIAEYVTDLFNADIDFHNSVIAGHFLHSQMANTKYRSIRGEQRNMVQLYMDFTEFYKELPDNRIRESWQLQKVLNGYNVDMYDICLLAMFLNVPVSQLIHMKLPEKSQEQLFDDKVRQLHENGMKYPEIARTMNASYDLVKPIGEGNYGKYHYRSFESKKVGTKRKNWEQIDADRLPLVIDAINRLQGTEDTRPRKITVGGITRELGLDKKALVHCPQCLAEIDKHVEVQERYWARSVVWAIEKAQREEKNIHWTYITRTLNIDKKDFVACFPYLYEFANDETVEMVKGLI